MSMYQFPASVSELIEKQLACGRHQSEDAVLQGALLRLDDALDDALQEVCRHSPKSEE